MKGMFEKQFETIDSHLRSASVAQIGGFRPDMEAVHSWFGGNFFKLPDEPWPCHENDPMVPVLQIRVDELPIAPPQFEGLALVSLFVSHGRLPVNFPSENGDGWTIRSYGALTDLVHVDPPSAAQVLRPFQIRWELQECEGPEWLEILEILDEPNIGLDNDFFEACHSRYHKHPFTKVGGWPATIQEPMHNIRDPFVFQVASEEKPRWMVGDNGKMYFFWDNDRQWSMYWDCY